MVVLSLLLILVSGGLLCAGILMGNDPLVMGSIGATLLAAVCLFIGIRQQKAAASSGVEAAIASRRGERGRDGSWSDDDLETVQVESAPPRREFAPRQPAGLLERSGSSERASLDDDRPTTIIEGSTEPREENDQPAWSMNAPAARPGGMNDETLVIPALDARGRPVSMPGAPPAAPEPVSIAGPTVPVEKASESRVPVGGPMPEGANPSGPVSLRGMPHAPVSAPPARPGRLATLSGDDDVEGSEDHTVTFGAITDTADTVVAPGGEGDRARQDGKEFYSFGPPPPGARAGAAQATTGAAGEVAGAPAAVATAASTSGAPAQASSTVERERGADTEETTTLQSATSTTDEPDEVVEEAGYDDPPDEPDAELLLSSEQRRLAKMDNDVHVVDGRPRFHLAECPHLADKTSQTLPIGEAVDLGFTPCSQCAAATTLLAQNA